VSAAPGIRTVLDLPVPTAKGIFAVTLGVNTNGEKTSESENH
jgi:hypothetical protein